MWNKPTKNQLSKIPPIYFNEDNKVATKDQKIHMHFFMGGCDWWISEYDPESGRMYGFANLNDPQCAEWGYVMLQELEQITVRGFMEVDRDKHWTIRPAAQVDEIASMCSWMLKA